jgi:hypothetical protein
MDRDDPQLARRLAWVLSMGPRLQPRHGYRAGVRKYRSLEEAHAEREQLEDEPQSPTSGPRNETAPGQVSTQINYLDPRNDHGKDYSPLWRKPDQ